MVHKSIRETDERLLGAIAALDGLEQDDSNGSSQDEYSFMAGLEVDQYEI